MILAEDEVNGADHSDLLLPDGLEPGTPLPDVPLVDQVWTSSRR
jgi:hypothetical protein